LFAFNYFHHSFVCLLLVSVFWDALPPLSPAPGIHQEGEENCSVLIIKLLPAPAAFVIASKFVEDVGLPEAVAGEARAEG
jgi:hypothetical protein